MKIKVRVYSYHDLENKKVKNTWTEEVELEDILLEHFKNFYEDYLSISIE